MASQGQAALWSAVEAVRSSWPVSPVSSSSTFTIGIHMEGSDVLNVSRRDSGDPRTTVVARAGRQGHVVSFVSRRWRCVKDLCSAHRQPTAPPSAIRALHRAAGPARRVKA